MGKKRKRAWAKHVEVGVASIRWTQVSINNRFGNSLPIAWTIEKLKQGEILPRELPLIRVAKFKGKYRSVDNRRLYCYKAAGIKQVLVVIIKEDRKMKQLFEKNKTKNNGTSVRIIEIELNPVNLDTKVITYDPLGEQAPKFWTVRQAIQELEGPAPIEEALILEDPMETSPLEGETEGETDVPSSEKDDSLGEIEPGMAYLNV